MILGPRSPGHLAEGPQLLGGEPQLQQQAPGTNEWRKEPPNKNKELSHPRSRYNGTFFCHRKMAQLFLDLVTFKTWRLRPLHSGLRK